jgi:hypothetical protein
MGVATRALVIQHCNGVEKTGVAPKTAVERRIEKVLKDLRIWS